MRQAEVSLFFWLRRFAADLKLYTEALAANSGETEPMAILKNARHERFAQNKAKGMSIGPAYTALRDAVERRRHTANVLDAVEANTLERLADHIEEG